MLLRYSAENFYSFRERVDVDFSISAQAGDRAGMIQSENGQNVNSVIGVFGANASGKTNLLKPLGLNLLVCLGVQAVRKPDSNYSIRILCFH